MAVSLKTLVNRLRIDIEDAKSIRRRMRLYEAFPYAPEHDIESALEDISRILRMFGAEHIPAGSNQKSPEIYYVNTGRSYQQTILFINGRFRCGDWGSIVESGNYA